MKRKLFTDESEPLPKRSKKPSLGLWSPLQDQFKQSGRAYLSDSVSSFQAVDRENIFASSQSDISSLAPPSRISPNTGTFGNGSQIARPILTSSLTNMTTTVVETSGRTPLWNPFHSSVTPRQAEPGPVETVSRSDPTGTRKAADVPRKIKCTSHVGILPPCPPCRLNCSAKISDEARSKFHRDFWKGSFIHRRYMINKHVTCHPCVSQNTSRRMRLDVRPRHFSREYYLRDDDGAYVRVCKEMFLHTLGKRTDGFLSAFFKSTHWREGTDVFIDHRGGPTRKRPWIEPEIVAHIQSFHPQISHYTREHAPLRRYLEASLSVRKLHSDFLHSNAFAKPSYETYRKIFRKQRITFGNPKADVCDLCIWGERHRMTKHGPNMPACLDCGKLSLHQKYVATGRAEYKSDKKRDLPISTAIFAVDMQKVLLLPVMRGKAYYFVSRLVCFNETFASLRNSTDTCVLWHEAIAGRNGSDVSSAFALIIRRLSDRIQDFIFWADNCAPQNKNWILFSTLIQLVNSPAGPSSVTMKYLEPGHTFMKADSIHGSIGRKLKEDPVLYDLLDFSNLVSSAKNDMNVLPMTPGDILPLRRIRSSTRGLPKLRSLKAVKFQRGSGSMYYKFSHDASSYFLRPFLSVSLLPELPSAVNTMRGINAKKKAEILSTLGPAMPDENRAFWEELPVAAVSDLCFDLH